MEKQLCFSGADNFVELEKYLTEKSVKQIMLICGSSYNNLKINESIKSIGIPILRFSHFTPNPDYYDALEGAKIFGQSSCDCILAIGGGSSIDVAKAIKLFGNKEKEILLGAIPTTAGSGSEVTKFIVLYKNNIKQSIEETSLVPQFVLYEPKVLETLPLYQRKATFLDALSHSIESMWSVNATEQSKMYASNAIEIILDNFEGYLKNEESANKNMMRAARLSGKAINISKTTICHAMSYKMVKMYGIAHGHAVGLCIPKVLAYTYKNLDRCLSDCYAEQLKYVLDNLAKLFGMRSVTLLIQWFENLLENLSLNSLPAAKSEDIKQLVLDINLDRLENYPIYIDQQDLTLLYKQILDKKRF